MPEFQPKEKYVCSKPIVNPLWVLLAQVIPIIASLDVSLFEKAPWNQPVNDDEMPPLTQSDDDGGDNSEDDSEASFDGDIDIDDDEN
jgi:hypothetical protein